MARFILAVLVCGVSVGARAEVIIASGVSNQERLDALLAIEAGPDDLVYFEAVGAMWHEEGSWEDDTLEIVGRFRSLTPSGAIDVCRAQIDEVRIPLPRTNSWEVQMVAQAGVHRCQDERDATQVQTVGIDSLNIVRNEFGGTNSPERLHAGDVNYDGTVDIGDLNLVRNTFGNFFIRTFTLESAAPVPEPSAITLLLPGLFALSMLRGRSRRLR